MRKRLIVVVLQGILIISSGCGASNRERRPPETSLIALDHPVQESWTVKLTITESGSGKGVIEAGHGAEYKVNSGTEHRLDKGVKVTLFDQSGTPTTSITAEKAVIHDNQDIEALGNVKIAARGGTVIRTEYAKRTARERMIRSDRFVEITRPGESVRGVGFESDENLKKFRIFRGSGEALLK